SSSIPFRGCSARSYASLFTLSLDGMCPAVFWLDLRTVGQMLREHASPIHIGIKWRLTAHFRMY
ncbi:MAG: hypothetical protein ABSG92_10010, partial [Conexivisphaerales archaeon]